MSLNDLLLTCFQSLGLCTVGQRGEPVVTPTVVDDKKEPSTVDGDFVVPPILKDLLLVTSNEKKYMTDVYAIINKVQDFAHPEQLQNATESLLYFNDNTVFPILAKCCTSEYDYIDLLNLSDIVHICLANSLYTALDWFFKVSREKYPSFERTLVYQTLIYLNETNDPLKSDIMNHYNLNDTKYTDFVNDTAPKSKNYIII
jgi:hypothetical protein